MLFNHIDKSVAVIKKTVCLTGSQVYAKCSKFKFTLKAKYSKMILFSYLKHV